MGLIVGTADGPIVEKDVSKVDSTSIPARLATKVMMVHLTLYDGSASIPIIHYPTQTATVTLIINHRFLTCEPNWNREIHLCTCGGDHLFMHINRTTHTSSSLPAMHFSISTSKKRVARFDSEYRPYDKHMTRLQ